MFPTLHRDIESMNGELAALRSELVRLRRSEMLRAEHVARLSAELRDLLGALLGDSGGEHSRGFFLAGSRLLELTHALDNPVPEFVEPSPTAQSPTDGTHLRTILSIEDCTPVVEVMQRILRQRPHLHIVQAIDGRTGLRLARELQPELILLDLHLPDMHGLELLQLLRQDPLRANTPVIVVSGDGLPSQIERMLQAGARNYLVKPLEIQRFLWTIDDALSC